MSKVASRFAGQLVRVMARSLGPLSRANLSKTLPISILDGRDYGPILLAICLFIAPTSAAETVVRDGVHLRLTSDVDDPGLLADMVDSFDAAVPQWLAVWGLPADAAARWKIDGYLMKNADLFRRSGALPANLPAFENGFATPNAIWVHFQSTAYYNRHLILHEGVHSLAFTLFGGSGPSWYSEGTAELLATHRDRNFTASTLDDGEGLLAQAADEFRINDLPQSAAESPVWGRYRVIAESRDAGTLPTLASVLKLPTDLHGDVESYTWCWAAAMMFTAYDDTRGAFIDAAQQGRDASPAFTTEFFREISTEWPAIRARWQVWLNDMEFGFDPQRYRVDLATDDLGYDGQRLTLNVRSDRGWQSAGIWFPAGTVRLHASGQCVIVAKENLHAGSDEEIVPRDWSSTPTGVSVQHHRGYPIGQLQVCVLPIPSVKGSEVADLKIQTPFVASVSLSETDAGEVSADTTIIQIDRPSWLLFRIHDVPGSTGRYQRADNRGGYQVDLSR